MARANSKKIDSEPTREHEVFGFDSLGADVNIPLGTILDLISIGQGTGQKVALWAGSGDSKTLTNAPIALVGDVVLFEKDAHVTGVLTTPKLVPSLLTTSYIPYKSANELLDSPISIDGTDVTVAGDLGATSLSSTNLSITSITTGNIPYKSAGNIVDSPISTDGTDVNFSGDVKINIDNKLFLSDYGYIRTQSEVFGEVKQANSLVYVSQGSNHYFLNDNGDLADTSAYNVTAAQYKVSALNTAPASATAIGTTGEIRYTEDYIYVCTATNTWKRTALTTW